MKGLFSGRTGSALMVGVVAVLAAGGGYAIAASTSNTIRACANKTSGALRIASRCKSTENTLSWNKVGPTGPRGLRGPIGPQGPGAKLLVYNAPAVSATGTLAKIGTAGPWTIYGICTIISGGAVQANLGFTGPAVTVDYWGDTTDGTPSPLTPSTTAYPASTVKTGAEPLGGDGYANMTGSGGSGENYTFISRSGNYLMNIVVTPATGPTQ
jgi:hypothetical protein